MPIEIETNPCKESEPIIAIKHIIKQAIEIPCMNLDFVNTHKEVIDVTAKSAISAEAKLGFPAVPITALPGLFQSIKSLPDVCNKP